MTIEEYRHILSYLRQMISGTEFEGVVYAVGGCCRDEILETDINDIDLAVNLPDGGVRFARWLNENSHTTGIPVVFERYGTAMLSLKAFPHEEIEIVQTRKGKYSMSESALPASAVFGTISDDAFRRDLTINTLYRNVSTDEMLDLTGNAIDDIHTHLLRTPMDADFTFDDDPVRILRCIRLSSQLGWPIHPDTRDAIPRHIRALRGIKIERIRAEFEKMLCGPRPDHALKMLRSTGLMPLIMPDADITYRTLVSDIQSDTVWNRILDAYRYLSIDPSPSASSPEVRWAVLLHGIAVAQNRVRRNRKLMCRNFFENDPEILNHMVQLCNHIFMRLHMHGSMRHLVTFMVRNAGAIRQWGPCTEHVKDRKILGFRRLCTNDTRLDKTLTFINTLNNSGPKAMRAPYQVDCVRSRLAHILAERKMAPAVSRVSD